MKEISSLKQFFSEIDYHFQCYNMGRRIHPVDQQTFIDFENTHAAWKTPFLQHAWLALLFWENKSRKNDGSKENPETPEHHVWFLKFPLDEQAKLNLTARDDFLRHLFKVLGDYLTLSQQGDSQETQHKTPSEKRHSLESAMQDSPYGFQPKPEQMANFHAIVHKQLSMPASPFYTSTQNYLCGSNDFKEWNKLGFQGFADIAARLDEPYKNIGSPGKTNEQLIIEAIPYLPIEPFQVLGSCLENHPISKQTTQVIYDRLITELKKNEKTTFSAQLCIASIRASSQASDQPLHIQLLSKILTSAVKTDIEVLAVISGRCWHLIPHPEILSAFLEALALANIQHQDAFKAILSDLMFIPGMRDTIIQAFRSPNRSQQLSQAIGDFFNTLSV